MYVLDMWKHRNEYGSCVFQMPSGEILVTPPPHRREYGSCVFQMPSGEILKACKWKVNAIFQMPSGVILVPPPPPHTHTHTPKEPGLQMDCFLFHRLFVGCDNSELINVCCMVIHTCSHEQLEHRYMLPYI